MTDTEIDKQWFLSRLEDQNLSLRGLAKHIEMDPSALSRTLSGQRKMQLDEAREIARFLHAPVTEVMRHAGVSVDLDGLPTRILLAASIDATGLVQSMPDPARLPQSVIDKAQAAISRAGNQRVIAAQIRSSEGPLSLWDDAVALFSPTERVEPEAIGTLAICRTMDGKQAMVRVLRARKTGEALVQCASGGTVEVTLQTAAPIIAIIP